MTMRRTAARFSRCLSIALTSIALLQFSVLGPLVTPARADGRDGRDDGNYKQDHGDHKTDTPIKHVIVIIGENRTFDHIFATYKPRHGESILNLLSEGIVKEDGTPGPNYALANQFSASDEGPANLFLESPTSKSIYDPLPPALTGGPTNPPFSTTSAAMAAENGLAPGYYTFLTTGGTGQATRVPDTRVMYDGKDASHLLPGPYQLTPGVPYDGYAASPVHRFYEMWQQMDCNVAYATDKNPSGCKADLFPWVEVTIGAGSNGNPQPSPFTLESTGEGSTSMGFYNMLQGDAPYLKELADDYSMSDNYHQAVDGGTGANHVMLGTGDGIWFSDGDGNADRSANERNRKSQSRREHEQLVHARRLFWRTYSECFTASNPGVAAVENYLQSLKPAIKPNCQAGHYYLLNNYNPGYYGDGTVHTATRREHRSRSRLRRCGPSATSCWRRTSRGSITATAGTTTSQILTLPRTPTATSAISPSTSLRS